MDRQIVYPGSIPLDTDLLNLQRNTMAALGSLAQIVLGTQPLVDGLACAPLTEGVAVVVGPGTITAQLAMDNTSFGSLPADSTLAVKTATNPENTIVQLGTWPDQSMVLCWLIQAAVQEFDDTPVALPYWNAADPTVPFSGPGNSGVGQNTRRVARVVLSAKSSGPLPTGTFAPPTADPGWIGLYGVTTSASKVVVAAEDIHPIIDTPVVPFRLPDLAPGFSRQQIFGQSTNWQVPRAVRRIRVRAVGGGGGGGGGTASFGGGGGGAGGYAESIIAVQPGQVFSITIGSSGTPAGPNSTGGAGGTTKFGDFVAATGGSGGASANPDSHGGAGGAGTSGTLLLLGGMGGDGPMVGAVPAGNGGSSAFGGGGRGANGGGQPADGRAPGSGAGGGYGANASGGIGASGLIIVEY
jgi:hypothetical protein